MMSAGDTSIDYQQQHFETSFKERYANRNEQNDLKREVTEDHATVQKWPRSSELTAHSSSSGKKSMAFSLPSYSPTSPFALGSCTISRMCKNGCAISKLCRFAKLNGKYIRVHVLHVCVCIQWDLFVNWKWQTWNETSTDPLLSVTYGTLQKPMVVIPRYMLPSCQSFPVCCYLWLPGFCSHKLLEHSIACQQKSVSVSWMSVSFSVRTCTL